VGDHDAVFGRGPTRELGITKEPAAKLADPEVEVLVGGPRIGAAGCR